MLGALLLLIPARAMASCEDVRIESVRSLYFGIIRVLPEVKSGLVTLWPTGDYNLSSGLSLSRGTEPTVGLVRVYAPSASRVELFTETYESTSTDTESRHTIENLQFYSAETLLEEKNGRLTFVMPKNNVAAQTAGETSITINVSANLHIKESVKQYAQMRANIRMRCLFQR